MRAKFKILLLLGLLFTLAPVVSATVLLNPPPPAPQNPAGTTTFTLYYAGGLNPTPTPGYIDSVLGFNYIWTQDPNMATNPNSWIWIDVSSTQNFNVATAGTIGVSLYAGTAASGSEVPIKGAGTRNGTSAPAACDGSTNCQPSYNGQYFIALNAPGVVTRIAFSLADLCAVATAQTSSLCTSGTAYQTINQSMLSEAMSVIFARIDPSVAATTTKFSPVPVTSGTPSDTTTFTINVSDIAPTVTCTSITESQFYFPGDTQIYLNSANLVNNNATVSGSPGPPVVNVIYAGRIGSTPPVPPAGLVVTDPTTQVVGWGNPSNTSTITGFVNSTNGSNNGYTSIVYAENAAGMVSDANNSCQPGFLVRAQTISGLLKESRCFIATAAYQSGRVAPVMLLRRFRDRVLSRFDWGKKFISKYYEVSPALAEWAWDKPMIRSLALKLLTPLEIAAWISLKVSGAEEVPASVEPYLDRVRKQIHVDPAATPAPSYSEEQKKSLERAHPNAEADSSLHYSDRQRALLLKEEEASGVKPTDADSTSENYTTKERAHLPPERFSESPTEMVKGGRDLKLGFGEMPPIRNAVSFRLGVTPGMQVTAQGSSNTFSSVYGASWQPDLLFHYERQLFHSENFGSLGLTGETGLSYAEGYGRLSFAFPSGSNVFTSQTKFSFVQVPLLFGLNYRLNALRVVRPYVGAGIGTMVYDEIRQDNNPDHHGYSFIYNVSGGVALLMDYLDRDAAHQAYLGEGIQHTFLFAEYYYLNTFASPVVFTRSGIYSGFLFEL